MKTVTTPGVTTEVTTSVYDDANRLVSVKNAAGHEQQFTYDALGRQTKVVSRDGTTTTASFSAQYTNGGRTVTRFPTSFSTLTQVDTFNDDYQLTGVKDELLKSTTYSLDFLGRVASARDDSSTLMSTASFDVSDNPRTSSYIGPEGSARSQLFKYTTYTTGDTGEAEDSDTGRDTLNLDLAGNVVDATNSIGGNRVTSTYDAINRVKTSKILDPISGAVLATVNFTYDTNPDGTLPAPKGRLTQISGTFGSIKYFYDAKGNLIKKTQSHGATNYTDSYTYDGAGRLLTMTYPSGREVKMTLNAAGKPSLMQTRPNASTAWTTVASNIGYYPFSGVSEAKSMAVMGGSTIASRLQDSAGRVTSYSDGTATVTAQYRADGLVSKLMQGTTTVASYDYDASNRLRSASGSGFATQSFTFETTGDLKSLTDGTTTTSVNYFNNASRVSSAGGKSWTYTQRGLVLSDGNVNLTYDARGMVATAKLGTGTVYSYTYDALGRRQSKTPAGGTATNFHYDTAGRLIAEFNPATGTTLREYIWLGQRPVMLIEGGTPYCIYTDATNTPIRLTSATGTTVWQWARNPFGSNAPSVRTVKFNLRMPGQYFDAETGLHYNGARYYQPSIGRYLQPDSAGEGGGVSAYSYADGDAVNFVDPSGNNSIFSGGGIRGGGSGGIGGGFSYMPDLWCQTCYFGSYDLAAFNGSGSVTQPNSYLPPGADSNTKVTSLDRNGDEQSMKILEPGNPWAASDYQSAPDSESPELKRALLPLELEERRQDFVREFNAIVAREAIENPKSLPTRAVVLQLLPPKALPFGEYGNVLVRQSFNYSGKPGVYSDSKPRWLALYGIFARMRQTKQVHSNTFMHTPTIRLRDPLRDDDDYPPFVSTRRFTH